MKRALPALFALALTGLLLYAPEGTARGVREGLALCAGTAIPSLFPLFVASSLLLKLGAAGCLQRIFAPFMGPMFRLPGACALPLLTGLLGGYPSGARAAAGLYLRGEASREEAERLLGFCDNCGGAFLLSFLGAGVLGSARAGAWLYVIHVTAALLTGMLLCRLPGRRGRLSAAVALPAEETSFPQALTSAVTESAGAMVNVCAFIVVFRALAGALPVERGWYLGLLELTTGASALPPGREGFVLAALLAGWGGLSVHCQAMAAAAPLSFRWHWAGKAIQGCLSAGLALLAAPLAL